MKQFLNGFSIAMGVIALAAILAGTFYFYLKVFLLVFKS